MTTLKNFTVSTPRFLPVLILADVSGSMKSAGKIDALNAAITEMLDVLSEESDRRIQIQVAIITFGQGEATVHQQLKPVSEISWENMAPAGKTPLGDAFDLARQMLENDELIPSRSYMPTIVLVSDGIPTDDWQGSLDSLLTSDRGSKAVRLAMAIGADAKMDVLEKFLADRESSVFQAHEARQIREFFRYVTMSVNNRTRSDNPNLVRPKETDWDDFDF